MKEGYYGTGIRYFRKLHDIKQVDLAKILSMTRQNLSLMEQNLLKVKDETLSTIAHELKTTVEDIKTHESKVVFHNEHQQGEQYNNYNITLPKSVLSSLETAIKTCHEALQMTHDQVDELHMLLAKSQDALLSANVKIADLEARLSL